VVKTRTTEIIGGKIRGWGKAKGGGEKVESREEKGLEVARVKKTQKVVIGN